MYPSLLLLYYIGRQFLLQFLMFISGLMVVVFVFDAVELIRRLSKYNNLSGDLVVTMASLKLPSLGLQIMPFAILFSCVFCLWRLTRSYELVSIRAAGISAWQFLLAPISVAVLLGFISVMLLNPVASVMLARYEEMEAHYISYTPQTTIALSSNGLWLRQTLPDGMAIIHATTIKTPEWVLTPATAFFFDKNSEMQFRIDADQMTLDDKQWVFKNASSFKIAENKTETFETLTMPTTLTRQEIESRFDSPDTVSFWNLPGYARVTASTGFSASPLWSHYYNLLSEPILNMALVLLAASIALRSPRQVKGWTIVIGSMVTAFLVFFLGDVLKALGISERLPLLLSSFAPALISLLAGVSFLLYREDG